MPSTKSPRRRATAYDRQVFINCPFDNEYWPLLKAIVFVIRACGCTPRSALENSDASEERLAKILRIIGDCKFSIHDLLSNTLQIVEGERCAAMRKDVRGGARASSPSSPASCRGVGRALCENGTFLARAARVYPAGCRIQRAGSPRSPAHVFLDSHAFPVLFPFPSAHGLLLTGEWLKKSRV